MTGTGTGLDPYVIQDVLDLQDIALDVTAYYILAGDIDATATEFWNGGLGFDPIGTFSGQLDGKGYKITNLYIVRPSEDNVALFGKLEGPTILNLGIDGGDIQGKDKVGSIAGFAEELFVYDDPLYWYNGFNIMECWANIPVRGREKVGGFIGELRTNSEGDKPHHSYITDCRADGKVTGHNPTTSPNQNVGGFIGSDFFSTDKITISRSYATGDVEGLNTSAPSFHTHDSFGGFIGEHNGIIIEDCWAFGNVSGASGGEYQYVGGFVGAARSTNGKIRRCFATGDVSGYRRVGGFVGYHLYPSIEDCYSRGNATATNSNAGGFVGENTNDDTLTHCYSTGIPSAPSGEGGFCGDAYDPADIVQCFWDTETSGTVTSDGGTGEQTSTMKTQSTFTDEDWDFNSIWAIDPTEAINDGYPYLRSHAGGMGPIWM